jgi:alcohol dehydrogenase (NADP+)
MQLQRRALKPNDVLLEMKYCGICHTDLHFAAGHTAALGLQQYPCVPGHELAGVCTAVGDAVTKVKVGDHVGVGCMVDSCGRCAACRRGEEQKCASQVRREGAEKALAWPPRGPL